MPAPGVPNNPAGVNGLYQQEAPYGAIKRLQQMTSAAPVATPRAVNAPRRAQRRAVNPPAQQTPPPYEEELATVWTELASLPGASPLVQEYAMRAQSGPR